MTIWSAHEFRILQRFVVARPLALPRLHQSLSWPERHLQVSTALNATLEYRDPHIPST